jgi:hypothetical protein
MLKRLSIALAMLAAMSLVVSPVAPAYAAALKSDKAKAAWVADHAKRGNIALLTREQMLALKQSNKGLYAKLWRAYRTSSVPRLTAAEKKVVASLTQRTLNTKAAGFEFLYWPYLTLFGSSSSIIPAVMGIFLVVIVLLIFYQLFFSSGPLALRRKGVVRRARVAA